MKVTDKQYLNKITQLIMQDIPSLISKHNLLNDNGGFEYLTKSPAVFPTNIKGNSIDLNIYLNNEMNKDKFKAGKESVN